VSADHRAACGVAVESIEAWTLGAPEAIAAVLGEEPATIRVHYKPHHAESFYQHSGKPEHRPKDLLGSLAQLGYRKPDAEFREEVALHTDVDALAAVCPRGFKPFAERLRAAFGPQP
jgi:hypothetical protein